MSETNPTEERPIIDVAGKIAELCLARGNFPLTKYAGPFVDAIDDVWTFAANGHRRSFVVPDTKERMGCELKPFEFAIWFNGWLAGIFDAYGGAIVAGEGANEATLIEALDRAIEKESKRDGR